MAGGEPSIPVRDRVSEGDAPRPQIAPPARARTHDRLTELLTAETGWPRLVSASSAADYRKIHREVVKQGRRIDYEAFMRRVDHLLAS